MPRKDYDRRAEYERCRQTYRKDPPPEMKRRGGLSDEELAKIDEEYWKLLRKHKGVLDD